MTVSQLIRILADYDANLPVEVDVEDKWQAPANSAKFVNDERGAYILISNKED